MSSLNRVMLIGRVGKDPEVRRMQSGDPVVNLSMATSETWRDKSSGEKKEKTEWHRIVCFNKGLCDVIEKYVHKGDLIYIEGQLQTRKWSKDGVDHYSTEIVLKAFNGELVMLGGKRDGGGDDDRSRGQAPASGSSSGFDHSELDDEIPF